MGELSDRFAELMARLAKSDADLFRAIGAQNADVRQLADDLAPTASGGSANLAPTGPGGPAALAPAAPEAPAALAPAGLLPPEACELKALKGRFGKLADAQAWLEDQIGPAPKKPTWAVIAQTCRGGAWPALAPARRAAATPKGLNVAELEERLTALERRLRQHQDGRFDRLEALLTVLVTALEKSST
jgi:hypothetical protein